MSSAPSSQEPAKQELKENFGKKISQEKDIKLTRELFAYVKQYPLLVFSAIALMILGDISAILPPYFLKQGLDINVPNRDLEGLYQNTFYLGLFLGLGFIFTISFNFLVTILGQKLILDIRMNIYKKVLVLTNSFYDRTPIGRTLTYLTNDVETLREFISEGLVTIVGNSIKILFILAIMFYINPILASFAFFSVPIFLIATLMFRVSLRTAYRGIRKANALINTLLVESITGIKEIILFNHKDKSIAAFDQENRGYLTSFLKVVKNYSLYFPIIELVNFLSTIAILYCAHLYTDDSNQIKTGEIFAFFFYITMFYRPLRDLAEQLNTFQSAMSASERIFNFLKVSPDFTESPAQKKPHSTVKGEITFNQVSFGYDPDKLVLKDISFSIQPGETIAIIGATGSGKTTLISLLNRLYEINQGSIQINGINLKDLSFYDLRSIISTLPQDTFLFTGSFTKNIDLLQEKTSDEIITAAKKSGIHAYIDSLKKKYQQNVLEEGKSLSTGQKQLVAFARAFLQDAPIVVLDEATANIDSESEKLIQDSLVHLTKERTTIIIAHRLSTIRNADRVLVMHQGRLVEQGHHQDLIKKKGIYQKLYEMQSIQSNY